MKLTPKQYELQVKKVLEERLKEEFPTKPFKIYSLKRYTGVSGASHEIDVSAELHVLGLDLILLVECKRFANSKVEKSDLMILAERIKDIGAHKGIFVTTIGYQRGAVQIAKKHGIALLTLTNNSHRWEIILPSFALIVNKTLITYTKLAGRIFRPRGGS